ncbi:OmpA family protein [Acidisphaera sp. S103]|uniref:OmpA family protein n=1 Tax=Acidisphaera sp. S103 TaxID=1747223 RepID=UPI00131B10B3|nr:OmpA family protein [Acidisphaera sp. S103]
MRPLPILSAILLTAATPVFAQVTVDLHALQALPDHPAASRPARPMPAPVVPKHPTVATRQAPATPAPQPAKPESAPKTASVAPAAPAPQPTMPENVPNTASIAPIAPPPPVAGAKPPTPPPVSAKAATEAAPTTTGLRLTFAPGESDLSPESSASIKQLTAGGPLGDMTTFNVLAYAPGKADDPSTARRVSLSRAMAVRSALVADGVPSARIFVRALGEQFGSGPPDRVDISVMGANAPTSTSSASTSSASTPTAAAR